MNGDIFYFTCVHSLKRGTELLPVEVNRLFEANFQWYFQYCKTFTKSEREGNLSCMWHYILVHVPSCYKGYGWKRRGRCNIYRYVIRDTNISLIKTKFYVTATESLMAVWVLLLALPTGT